MRSLLEGFRNGDDQNNVSIELNREARRSLRHQGVEGWLGGRIVIINDVDLRIWLEGQARYRRVEYRVRQLEFLPVNPGGSLTGEVLELSWVRRQATIDQWGYGGGGGVGYMLSRDLGLVGEVACGLELNRGRLHADPRLHPVLMRLSDQWDNPLYHGLIPYLRLGLALSLGSL